MYVLVLGGVALGWSHDRERCVEEMGNPKYSAADQAAMTITPDVEEWT